jgi:hypothetical protein
MELPREFVHWKNYISDIILERGIPIDAKSRASVDQELKSFFDRLWFEASLELISKSEAYGGRGTPVLPLLFTIDDPDQCKLGKMQRYDAFSLWRENAYCVIMQDSSSSQTTIKVTDKKLGDETTLVVPSSMIVICLRNKCKSVLGILDSGEAFEPVEKFELIERKRYNSIARNSAGFIFPLKNSTSVNRRSDLAKGQDGNSQSKIALASFAVAHCVNHRTFQINRCFGTNENSSFLTTYVGTAQVLVSLSVTIIALPQCLFNSFYLSSSHTSCDFMHSPTEVSIVFRSTIFWLRHFAGQNSQIASIGTRLKQHGPIAKL